MAGPERVFVSGNFDFMLDGVDCGMIKSIEGGNYKGEVMRLANSSGYLQPAQLGNVSIDDFKLQLAGIDGEPLRQWIDATLAQAHMYKHGEVRAKNFNQEVLAIRKFEDALITEIGLPACKGESKEPAYVALNFAAERVKMTVGGKEKAQGKMNMKQKRLTQAAFRLTVDKIKSSCNRIASVDALVAKQGVKRDDIGGQRIKELVPGKVDLPNLSFTLPTVDAKEAFLWAEDFIWNGNCGQESETNAELVYYSQDYKEELLKVEFQHVGIFNIVNDKVDDHSDAINRVKIECYMEAMKIHYSG